MWILPTKGRAEACSKLVWEMSRCGQTNGILIYNEDDYDSLSILPPSGWRLKKVPSGTVGSAEALRLAFALHPNEPWYGLIADDCEIVSRDFGQRLIDRAGTWGIATANDGSGRMQTATVIGGDLVRSVGYIAPPGFRHLYIDDVWEAIGDELLNWSILDDVIVKHDHPLRVGGEMDKTHRDANSEEMYAHDGALFAEWVKKAPELIWRVRNEMWSAHNWSIDLAKSRSLMLGFPVYDKVNPQHEASAMDTACLLARLGIKCCHAHAIGKPIHQARNSLAEAFMASGMTDLLMVDADMSWNAWDVVKLLAVPHPLIAGVGKRRNDDDTDYCFRPLAESIEIDQYGMCEVEHVGTGFMRIHRCVFEGLRDAHPEWQRRKDTEGTRYYTRYFHWSDDEQDEVSEDIRFCRDLRAIGGRVYIDPQISLGHYGPKRYDCRVADILSRS